MSLLLWTRRGPEVFMVSLGAVVRLLAFGFAILAVFPLISIEVPQKSGDIIKASVVEVDVMS